MFFYLYPLIGLIRCRIYLLQHVGSYGKFFNRFAKYNKRTNRIELPIWGRFVMGLWIVPKRLMDETIREKRFIQACEAKRRSR